MAVAVLVIAGGVIALLFYVMYLVKPKRIKLTAEVWKLARFNVEADSQADDGKLPHHKHEAMPDGGLRALSDSDPTALPKGGGVQPLSCLRAALHFPPPGHGEQYRTPTSIGGTMITADLTRAGWPVAWPQAVARVASWLASPTRLVLDPPAARLALMGAEP
jgi:hypothetical protein